MAEQTTLGALFRYQAWANAELLEKIELLDPDRHAEERRTVLRLLNHCHVVNRIFAAHLAGTSHDYPTDNTPETPESDDLRLALAASDRWYLDYLQTVTSAELSEAVPFVFTDGDTGCMSREEMLLHVVTHGGYHRGEAGRILASLGVSPPWDTFAVYLHATEPLRRQPLVKSLLIKG